jgi:hypothetical protein
MKWTGKGHFGGEKDKVMYSGHETHKKNGVGMIITKQVEKSLIGYKAVNDRIMYIRVEACPVNITWVQVYAPTTGADEKDIDEFYRSLQAVLNEIPRKDVAILMGDWNAKIGKWEELETVGKYGLGNRNKAGGRLLEFCEENSLFIANTLFKQPERRLYTWTSPDGKYKNQIDYIIRRRRWKSAIQTAKTRPDADCSSDHSKDKVEKHTNHKEMDTGHRQHPRGLQNQHPREID